MKIDTFTTITHGFAPPNEYILNNSNGYPWVTPQDLSQQQTKYINNGKRSLSDTVVAINRLHRIEKGSLLLSTRCPAGILAVANSDCYIGNGILSIVPNPYICDSEYFYYVLMANVK